MTLDVYGDLLFLINFSMDYLCLYITYKIMHTKTKKLKIVLSSIFGGIYSVVSLFWLPTFGPPLLWDIAICVLMCLIAFSQKGQKHSRFIVYTLLYFGVSMTIGGCMTALFNLINKANLPINSIQEDDISIWLFAILACIAGVCSLRGGKLLSREVNTLECIVEIFFDGKSKSFKGLFDSGNLAFEPISGKKVIFIEKNSALDLVDFKIVQNFLNGEMPSQKAYKNMRFIMTNTTNKSSLCATLNAQKIIIHTFDKTKNKNFKFSSDALFTLCDMGANSENYQAIVPVELINN